jgi:hypothetical protein
MWTWLISFITGPLIGKVLGAVTDSYKAKLAAGNTTERIAADLASRQILLDQREAELNASVVIAEQGNWVTRMVRPLFALPFILFTWKVVLWDKVLGHLTGGTTDPLDPKMWGVFMLIVGAYFGGRTIEKATNIIADAFGKKIR